MAAAKLIGIFLSRHWEYEELLSNTMGILLVPRWTWIEWQRWTLDHCRHNQRIAPWWWVKRKREEAVMSLLNEFVIKTAYFVSKAYVKKLKFSSCWGSESSARMAAKSSHPKSSINRQFGLVWESHRRNFERCVITSLEQVQSNLESKTAYLCCPIWLHRMFYKICDTQSCRSCCFEGLLVLNTRHILPLSPTMC